MKDSPLSPLARYAVYCVVLLWAGFEVLRSLGRVDGVIFSGYVQVGEAVLQHSDPYGYALTLINTWPPFFFFIGAALAWLARISLLGALFLWQVLGVLSIWGTLKLGAKLFLPDGHALSFWPRADRLSLVSLGVVVPFAMTLRLFQEHLQHTQINVQVLFLTLLAFDLFRRGKWGWGGWWLALAASIKALPVVLVLYLVYKRQWRAVAWTALFLVLLNAALPAVVFGPAHALADWQRWRMISARGMMDPTPSYYNQSLLAALKRLLTIAGSARDPVHYAIAAWPTARVVQLFEGVALCAAAGLAWLWRRHPRDLNDPRSMAELAVGLGAMIIVDPLAWKAHFVTLIAAYFLIFRGLRLRPLADPRWWWWWASFVCLTLSAPLFVGNRINNVLESWNVILVGAVIVVGLALWSDSRTVGQSD
jgi:glycosyl transferase family 87